MVAVDQSSALQVETLGTNLVTGGLQEQIESGDWSKETADTQQVNSSVEDEDGEEDDEFFHNRSWRLAKGHPYSVTSPPEPHSDLALRRTASATFRHQVQRDKESRDKSRGECARMWSC